MNKAISQQPTIMVNLMPDVGQDDVAQLFYGMEEEGIPFQLIDQAEATLIERAYVAASRSPLLVGVAVSREQIIIHYKNLPIDSPLFVLQDYARQESSVVRTFGCNAARLVKGQPFKDIVFN